MGYIPRENGNHWSLGARRLEEVAALMPQRLAAGVEPVNACLRLGDGALAYQRLLDRKKTRFDKSFPQAVRKQIAYLAAGGDPANIELWRDLWLELVVSAKFASAHARPVEPYSNPSVKIVSDSASVSTAPTSQSMPSAGRK
ncbi:MAG: hypothetical protein ABIO59_06150 [Luteimonas sp.]